MACKETVVLLGGKDSLGGGLELEEKPGETPKLKIRTGQGITLVDDDVTNDIGDGLEFSSDDKTQVKTGDGIKIDNGAVAVDVGDGIKIDGGKVAADAADGAKIENGKIVAKHVGRAGTSYHQEKANRSFNTDYTNSNDYPIFVSVVGSGDGVHKVDMAFYVDGLRVGKWKTGVSGTTYGTLTAIVPAGSTYQVAASGNSVVEWYELKV